MGLLMTAYGINQTRLSFGQPGMLEKLRQWWQRAPWKPLPVVEGSGNATLAAPHVFAHGTVGPPPGATMDERLARAEESLALLHQAFSVESNRTREREAAQEQAMTVERSMREENYKRAGERLEEAQTSGLGGASVGLFWAALGTVLGGASGEIERLLQFLGLAM